MGSSSSSRGCAICSLVIIVILAGLITAAILLSLSWQYVEYYEYALLKQRSTGLVDRTKIYTNQRLFRGPDYTTESYTSTSHHVRLTDLEIATFDRVGIKLSVTFQYFLRREEIVNMHDQYKQNFNNIVIDRATDSLKAKAPSFTVRQYISNRSEIAVDFFQAIRERLEGSCCYEACQQRNSCLRDCKKAPCPVVERGLFVEVRYFQLLSVEIHVSIAERLLRALLLHEKAEKATLDLQAIVVRKETENLAQQIIVKAFQITQAANAEWKKIREQAQSNKTAILESARKTGLFNLYGSLSISDERHRNTFDYLRTLRHEDSSHLTVDFQQRMVGSWSKP